MGVSIHLTHISRRSRSIDGVLEILEPRNPPSKNSVEPGGSAALAGSTAGPTFATLTCQAWRAGLGGSPGVGGKF